MTEKFLQELTLPFLQDLLIFRMTENYYFFLLWIRVGVLFHFMKNGATSVKCIPHNQQFCNSHKT